jgi:hypothetical protein
VVGSCTSAAGASRNGLMEQTIPLEMPDPAALRILKVSMMTELNGLGQAVVIVACQGREHGHADEITHAIMCINPRTLELVSCVAQYATEHVKCDVSAMAGTVVDLAQTLVMEHRERLLTPPSRR